MGPVGYRSQNEPFSLSWDGGYNGRKSMRVIEMNLIISHVGKNFIGQIMAELEARGIRWEGEKKFPRKPDFPPFVVVEGEIAYYGMEEALLARANNGEGTGFKMISEANFIATTGMMPKDDPEWIEKL